jgi:hypothetical protein
LSLQPNDLAQKNPQKLAEMKRAFDAEAKVNKVYPIGGGIEKVTVKYLTDK